MSIQLAKSFQKVPGHCSIMCLVHLNHHHVFPTLYDAKSPSSQYGLLCDLHGQCLCHLCALFLWGVDQYSGEPKKVFQISESFTSNYVIYGLYSLKKFIAVYTIWIGTSLISKPGNWFTSLSYAVHRIRLLKWDPFFL